MTWFSRRDTAGGKRSTLRTGRHHGLKPSKRWQISGRSGKMLETLVCIVSFAQMLSTLGQFSDHLTIGHYSMSCLPIPREERNRQRTYFKKDTSIDSISLVAGYLSLTNCTACFQGNTHVLIPKHGQSQKLMIDSCHAKWLIQSRKQTTKIHRLFPTFGG